MKILLLQSRRDNDPAKQEEINSFATRAGIPSTSFYSHSLLLGPPELETLSEYDAMMIGGSGEFYVSKNNLPLMDQTISFLQKIVTLDLPVLASCFGFHLLTVALGGKVIQDPHKVELGTFRLELNGSGLNDELFNVLPATFMAQLGHTDRATVLPQSVINLCSSSLINYQGFRVKGKAIWATQFHPELTGSENLHRYKRYLALYQNKFPNNDHEEVVKLFRPSPDTEKLIPQFLDLITP